MLSDHLVVDTQARLCARIDQAAAEVGPGFPHVADGRTGRWRGEPAGAWTDGFWVGACWLAHALTGQARYRDWGLTGAERLRGRERAKTHDLGFLFHYGAALGWGLTRIGVLRELALGGAEQLALMADRRAGVIPVGAQAEVAAGEDDVTIDCMMNLQLLWWAAAETGAAAYREIALAHAERTADWHVRPDGSCVQSVHFEPATGEPSRKHTHQGYGPGGCWSRGLAWCAYGFVEAYRATGRERFLEVAEGAIAYHARRMPPDGVPFYDYDDPRIPGVPRDSSAAAILASACLALAHLGRGEHYRGLGGRLLAGLVGGYMTPVGPRDPRPPGMLLHTCYNFPAGRAPDDELIWGDYFLLEALARWQGLDGGAG